MGGPGMLKYFITSIWFWGFAPIASLVTVLLFILGVIGFADIAFNIMQWVMPWGIPVIIGRIFVLLLLLVLLVYIISLFFKLVLICMDNGMRGVGFIFAATFFIIRAFFRYYSAGIWIQGILVILYEMTIELISLFYLFYWSVKRYLLKIKNKIVSLLKKRKIGFGAFIISKFLFFVLNQPFLKKKETLTYYRRFFGWCCYSYYINKWHRNRIKITVIEHRELCLKYMDTTVNVTDNYNLQIVVNRRYLFNCLELMDDKEPEIWREHAKKLL